MLQLSEKTESSLSKSIASISNSVPKLSKVLELEKSKETGVWAIEPKKIHITINDPVTVNVPKLLTDGKTDGKEEKPDKSFIGDIKKALGMKPKSAEAMRIKAEEKQKKADARAKKRHDAMAGWFKDMGKSLKKGLTDNPIVNFIKDHWGKIMIAAMAIFLKPEQWKTIWQGIKDLANWAMTDGVDLLKGIWETLKKWVPKLFDGIVEIVKFIGRMIDSVFGKKATEIDYEGMKIKDGESEADFDKRRAEVGEMKDGKFVANKRQGGLFGGDALGETGLMDKLKGFGSLALSFVTGLTLLTGSFAPIMMALKLFGGGLRLGGRGLRGFAKVGGVIKDRIAPKAPGGAPKAPGGAPKAPGGAPKITATPTSTMSTTAKPPKPPSAMSKVGATAGKWASKFPKLAKGMKFLTKLPGPIGKAFMVGPLVASLAGGADKKTIIPMIGSMLGGIGGGMLGSLLGGMIGLAGGPLALVTGALGGIAGGMLGDSLGMGLAQWLVGDKVDALPWGFGWMEDLINSGKMQEEGELSPETGGGKVGGSAPIPKPMTKTQFLQSEKYKGQMRGADGVVAGESSAGKQMAYEEYLEEEKQAPAIKSSAKAIKKELKTVKRLPKVIREKSYAKLNRFLDNSPNGDAILRELKPRELKQLGRDGASSEGGEEKSQLSMAEKKRKLSAQMNGEPMVSPTMKGDTLNQVQGENAVLSGSNAVVAPTTTTINNITNNYGGGESGSAIYGVPTAQKGQQHRHSNIR